MLNNLNNKITEKVTKLILSTLISFAILGNFVYAQDSQDKTKCMSHPAMQEVKKTVDEILVELEKVKSQIKSNPKVVYGIIDKLMVPKADFQVMSQLVLTRNWRGLSAQQKKAFMLEFQRLMIRTYGVAFESYDGETVEYVCPVRTLKGSFDRVEIKTVIHSLNRPDSTVKFRIIERNKSCNQCNTKIKSCKLLASKCKEFSAANKKKELESCKQDYDDCKQGVDECQTKCDLCQECEDTGLANLDSCRDCDFDWLVYDLIIDNISIIDSYRQIFADKFRKQGADAIIADMHNKNCKDVASCS